MTQEKSKEINLNPSDYISKLYDLYWNCVSKYEYIVGVLNLFSLANILFAIAFPICVFLGIDYFEWHVVCFIALIATATIGFIIPYVFNTIISTVNEFFIGCKNISGEKGHCAANLLKLFLLLSVCFFDLLIYLIALVFCIAIFFIYHEGKITFFAGFLEGKVELVDTYLSHMQHIGLPWYSIFIGFSMLHFLVFYKKEYLANKIKN